LKYKNFHIQSTEPIDNKIISILDEAEAKLSLSEIYDSTLQHDIYLCNNFGLYTLLAPLSRRAFACNYPLFNNIFVAEIDLPKNEAYKNNPNDSYSREISSLIAHEISHTFIEKRLGFWKFRTLSPWKNEGYSEYVGLGRRELSDEDKEFIGIHQNNKKPGIDYHKYYIAANYLVGFKQLSFDELMATDKSLADVLEEIVATE
jgi:hypothetical protein